MPGCAGIGVHILPLQCSQILTSLNSWEESGHAGAQPPASGLADSQSRNARNALPQIPCPHAIPPTTSCSVVWAPIPVPEEFFPQKFAVIYILLSLNVCDMFVLFHFIKGHLFL